MLSFDGSNPCTSCDRRNLQIHLVSSRHRESTESRSNFIILYGPHSSTSNGPFVVVSPRSSSDDSLKTRLLSALTTDSNHSYSIGDTLVSAQLTWRNKTMKTPLWLLPSKRPVRLLYFVDIQHSLLENGAPNPLVECADTGRPSHQVASKSQNRLGTTPCC